MYSVRGRVPKRSAFFITNQRIGLDVSRSKLERVHVGSKSRLVMRRTLDSQRFVLP